MEAKLPSREDSVILRITQRSFAKDESHPINEQPHLVIFQPGQERLDDSFTALLFKYADEAGVMVMPETETLESLQQRNSGFSMGFGDIHQMSTSTQWRGDQIFPSEDRAYYTWDRAYYTWVHALFISIASAGSLGVISRALVDYAKTRRSSVHVNFYLGGSQVDIDLKQHPDPAREIARIVESLRASETDPSTLRETDPPSG